MRTQEQVYERTLKAYRDVLGKTPVCLETRLGELPFDSLDIMSAILDLEENYDIRFRPAQEERIFDMHSGNNTLQHLAIYLFEIISTGQTEPAPKFIAREKLRTREEAYQRVVSVAKKVGKNYQDKETLSGDTRLAD